MLPRFKGRFNVGRLDAYEADLGTKLKALRLVKNIEQRTLAERAGVSVSALKSLENGAGSSLHTLVRVLKALGRESWLDTIAPVATINPMQLTVRDTPRQRARR